MSSPSVPNGGHSLCIYALKLMITANTDSGNLCNKQLPNIFRMDFVKNLTLVEFYDSIMEGFEDNKKVDNCCAQLVYNVNNKRKIKHYHAHGLLATALSLCLKFHASAKDRKNLCRRFRTTKSDLFEREMYILILFSFDIPIQIPKAVHHGTDFSADFLSDDGHREMLLATFQNL
tara:strand:+ start:2307 stop:2831 length:525 start_codon:yes stop_codon:yes gene_type:complete